jgi:hypothetical protein
MINIDFWVPSRIAECPAEFSEFLENEIWDRIRNFRDILLWKHVYNAKYWLLIRDFREILVHVSDYWKSLPIP